MNEKLEAVVQAFKHSRMAFAHLNNELERSQYVMATGERFEDLYKCLVVMDDIFSEEFEPVFKFIEDNFKDGQELCKMHTDLKVRMNDGTK